MLQENAVEPGTLSLLESLMVMPELKSCNLVRGTALALKFGHRLSVDLDLFSTEKLGVNLIVLALQNKFGKDFQYEKTNVKWAVFCYINGIKVDVVNYPHVQLDATENHGLLRLYTNKDIAAMKINAILGRGAKKDFYVLVELLTVFSLKEIIGFYEKKYPNQMFLVSLSTAITYFDDAETDADPIALKGQTWEQVKKTLQFHVREYLK